MAKKRWPWICFALCYFGYMSLYICRNNLSTISPLLVEEGIATASILDVATYSGLGISSAIFGAIIGRFGLDGYQVMFGCFVLTGLIGYLLLLKKKTK